MSQEENWLEYILSIVLFVFWKIFLQSALVRAAQQMVSSVLAPFCRMKAEETQGSPASCSPGHLEKLSLALALHLARRRAGAVLPCARRVNTNDFVAALIRAQVD